MSKLKIAGAWSGALEAELDTWTVAMLRQEVARRSDGQPGSINLIFAGKVLKDGDGSQKLSEIGVKNNAKILASRVSADEGKELMAEAERSNRLARLKAAATSLAMRHLDGSLPVEDFNIELENQSGEKVQMGSETDQRAVMMGLMLHANAKQLIRRTKYKDALEVLAMGEEAFSLCNSSLIEMIDNIPILQIDMVWCYFMLRDISWLSVAGVRLLKAREGIERAHGKEATRVRLLQGGRCPELALHLRLELLEGVVAYHIGQLEKSRSSLGSAQAKHLQVPDEALSLLMSMGYQERRAKRALRMNNQDIESAVDFLVEEKARKAQKVKDNIRRQEEISYGKDLAAEALRRNENDIQKALDDLTNPETNSSIQLDIESSKKKRQRVAVDTAINELAAMGFPREAVISAVHEYGTQELARSHLFRQYPNAMVVEDDNDDSTSRPSDRDVEMEDELTGELQRGDAFSDYDIDVTEEGEAIREYLALLTSAETVELRN
ncbi:hypothetical protein RJ640_022665 [Escallonia rubra]|uniref:NEDD8 ultimate buster 1 n=1 Tax=Escallonia rubra TaxID=112253 RepID=A0AA88R7W1_9ASTE|nr:hypothetical protein RJ640_022665 [Escallonia rubra]